jgi:hypothetical protein
MTQPGGVDGFHFGQLEQQIADLTQNGDVVGGTGGAEQRDLLAPIRGRSIELFRDTEGGNGDRMAARHGDFILCDKTAKNRVYYIGRQNGLWVEDRDGEIVRRADEVVQEMYARAALLSASDDGEEGGGRGDSLAEWARSSDNISAMHNMAALSVDKYRRRITAVEYFDREDHVVSTESGVLLLAEDGSVTLRARKLADRCTLCTAAPYTPEILENPPDLIKMFIEKFLPEEGRVELIFKLLGYALRGGNPRRLFVILKGGTTSGKTQLARGVIETLGGYVGASPATVFRTSHDDKPRPDVIALYRKRIAFFAEASKSWRLEASRIKHFTGGDIDPQRGMRSDIIQQGQPACLPFIYTNEMPKIIGLDEATKRRVIVPTMDHTIAKKDEDPTIKERFMRDPAVRAWLLAALVRGYTASRTPITVKTTENGKTITSVEHGMWDVEQAFSLSTSDAINEMYHLSDFLDWLRDGDNPQLGTVPDPDAYGVKSTFVTQAELYGRYTYWVKSFGDRYDRFEQLSLVDFNRQLESNHAFVRTASGGRRWRGYTLRDITLASLQSINVN